MASSIEKLPADILEKLRELLRDPRVTQLQATHQINEILLSQGDSPISKSSVNRYSVKMKKIGEKLTQSREVAKMWIGKLGASPQGQVGHLLNEIVRNLAFETAISMAEGDEPAPPKALKELAMAIERLEKAASENVKRENEIKEKMAEEAKKEISSLEKKGFDKDTLNASIEAVYGIVRNKAEEN